MAMAATVGKCRPKAIAAPSIAPDAIALLREQEPAQAVPALARLAGEKTFKDGVRARALKAMAAFKSDGVEPLTAVIDNQLRLRDDVVNDGNVRDDVLKNAPDAQHGFFAVPKVIE